MNSETKSGFVALVGATNSGKSTLLNALLGKKIAAVSPRPQTTRNRILGIRRTETAEIIIVDTPGVEGIKRMGALAGFLKHSLAEGTSSADVVALLTDAKSVARRLDRVQEALAAVVEPLVTAPHLVLLNKCDLLAPQDILPLIAAVSTFFQEKYSAAPEVIPISALTGEGLDVLERVVVERLPVGPFAYPQEMTTDAPEEFVIAEYIREKLYFRLKEELPYSSAVQVMRTAEKDDVFHIDAVIYVERESQKGIVIGSGGAMLKAIGTAARADLEKLFGMQVCLKLHVQVAEGWTESDRGLRKVGMM